MLKNRSQVALAALLLLTLAVPAFVLAQQGPGRRRDNSATTPAQPAPSGPSGRTGRRVPADATSALEQDFAEALGVVEENYVDGSKLDYNNTFKSSIIGMLRTLDPHSNYYDAKEFEEMRTDWRSEYYGIGATIGDRSVGDQTDTYILATFEHAPAAKAGLRFGDKLIAVNEELVHGKSSSEVRDKLRGPRGSSVKVTIERAADRSRQTVEITRDAVPQPSVPDAYMLKNGVGYIDMTRGFNYTTADEFKDAVERLHQQGMTSLVLDLRNNPGGLLDQAVRVASHFLQNGQVVLSQRGRIAGSAHTYRSDNANPDNVPLVVLVNRGTASASEIVAGALQDHDRALVIGETSFGKGLVQSIIPLEYGTALTLTSSKYYTPSGRLVQRDYTNEGLYDYYTHGGGVGQDEDAATPAAKPSGAESKTDTGRSVYGGGGITPDEAVKPRLIAPTQQRVINPVFMFARELVNGRINGFESYKVAHAIEFDHNIKADEYPVTDNLFKAFKQFVASEPAYKLTEKQLDASRDFVTRQLRYDISTAAYGSVAATQVLAADDPQVTKAIDNLPRARELAAAALRGRNPVQKSFE